MQTIYNKIIYLFLSVILMSGCNKIIEVNPPVSSVNSKNVYQDDATAASVLNGIYAVMANGRFTTSGITGISLFLGLSADELTLYSSSTNQVQLAYYKNNLTSSITGETDFWNNIYPLIFTANSAIEGLTTSTGLTPAVKQQLLGEAKFMRAFFYFYLINLYGDVPLILSTDYTINASMTRTAGQSVYDNIVSDLQDAKNLLIDGYVMADAMTTYPITSAERVRPNKWAATALLARVYLYIGDFAKAEVEATNVINNTALFKLEAINKVFLKNSAEAIWQLQPVLTGQNTQDARTFILSAAGPGVNGPVYLTNDLINSFEPGDYRRFNRNWIDSVKVGTTVYYFPYKYKLKTTTATSIDEYVMVLRLSEQYLIRAEARARQGNYGPAKEDMNVVRSRANLPNTPVINDKNAILAAILKERRWELFTEWGHRWLDLKRTGQVDAVMSAAAVQKGSTWETTDQLYPISASEIQRNKNLEQNSGY